MTIEEKFARITKMTIFYTDVSVNTGVSIGTITTSWFNLQRGINIQNKYIKIVNDSLDRCLAFETAERELMIKYFNR